MSISATYPSHADARKAGWFSRRHQTNDAHRAEQERWQAERQEKADREAAQLAEALAFRAERLKARAK